MHPFSSHARPILHAGRELRLTEPAKNGFILTNSRSGVFKITPVG